VIRCYIKVFGEMHNIRGENRSYNVKVTYA